MAEPLKEEVQIHAPHKRKQIGKSKGKSERVRANRIAEVMTGIGKRLAVVDGLRNAYYTADGDEIYLLCDISEDDDPAARLVCDIHREIAKTYPDIFIELGILDFSRDQGNDEWTLHGLEKL